MKHLSRQLSLEEIDDINVLLPSINGIEHLYRLFSFFYNILVLWVRGNEIAIIITILFSVWLEELHFQTLFCLKFRVRL